MLHEVILALTLALPPQALASGSPPPAPDTLSRATAEAAERSVIGRTPPRFATALLTEATSPGGPPAVPVDTPVKRPRAIVYSDWYARRLAIHRVASYTLLPLLAAQYYTGSQLMAKGADAPLWVIRTHAPLATTAAVVFGLNTVTGVWNLWDARKDPNGRFSRTAHALLMLASDAGFLAAGSIGHKAVQDGATRSLHRTIALSSMGVALVGYAIMLPPFRR